MKFGTPVQQWLRLSLKTTIKVIRIHPVSNMNVCTKFHVYPKVVETFRTKAKMSSCQWCYKKGQCHWMHCLDIFVTMNLVDGELNL